VFTWASTPAPTTRVGLFCQHCGGPFDGAAPKTEIQDAAQRIQ
jgi:hypothetical protein